MKINVINWILSKIESGEIAEEQIVSVYDKNNNVVYLGKAGFVPLSLWDEFKTATIVDNELRINERQPERATVKIVMERIGNELRVCGYFYSFCSAKNYWRKMQNGFNGGRNFEIHTTYIENVPYGAIIKL